MTSLDWTALLCTLGGVLIGAALSPVLFWMAMRFAEDASHRADLASGPRHRRPVATPASPGPAAADSLSELADRLDPRDLAAPEADPAGAAFAGAMLRAGRVPGDAGTVVYGPAPHIADAAEAGRHRLDPSDSGILAALADVPDLMAGPFYSSGPGLAGEGPVLPARPAHHRRYIDR